MNIRTLLIVLAVLALGGYAYYDYNPSRSSRAR
jgi:hypothetical protein